METITSGDGTTIAYQRTGSGPPLVFVHGATVDHTNWDFVRPAFEEQFTVYAIDRRGRGGSGDAAEYDIEREFEDVTAVVASIDEPVVLVGNSIGALCSLEAALRTENLRGLVLYEPPISVGDHAVHSAARQAKLEALLADGEHEQVLEAFLREVALTPPERELIEVLRATPSWSMSVRAAPTIVREYAASGDYQFDATRFAELSVPTLLVVGSESPPAFKAAIDDLDEVLPNSRTTVLDGQAHVAMVTDPEHFVEEVLTFTGDEPQLSGAYSS